MIVPVLALALAVSELPTTTFDVTDQGPKTTVAVGGRITLLTSPILPLPSVAVDVVHEIDEDADYVLRLSTIGVLTAAETGIRSRITTVGDCHFAANAQLGALFGVGKNADNNFRVAGVLAFMPGLAMTYAPSPEETRVTLGLDLPITFAETGFSDVGRSLFLRPSVAFEFGRTYAKVETYIPASFHRIAPTFAVGYAW